MPKLSEFIKDGYGKHWEWEGHKPYWWCPDDDMCGPHPSRKEAVACWERRHSGKLNERTGVRPGDPTGSNPEGEGSIPSIPA